jgi:hypothetical protein
MSDIRRGLDCDRPQVGRKRGGRFELHGSVGVDVIGAGHSESGVAGRRPVLNSAGSQSLKDIQCAVGRRAIAIGQAIFGTDI